MLSSEKKKTSSLISMPHLQVFDESEAENYSTSGHCKLAIVSYGRVSVWLSIKSSDLRRKLIFCSHKFIH